MDWLKRTHRQNHAFRKKVIPSLMCLLMALMLFASYLPTNVNALSINGVGNGVSGATSSASGAYLIRWSNQTLGFRVTLVDATGARVDGTSPYDIYNNSALTTFVNDEETTLNRFTHKYSKMELAQIYETMSFPMTSATGSSASTFYDAYNLSDIELGISNWPSSAADMESWPSTPNMQKLLWNVWGTNPKELAAQGWAVTMEPIYEMKVGGKYMALTVTEAAIVAAADGTAYDSPTNYWDDIPDTALEATSWKFFSTYTHGEWPQSLTLTKGQFGIDKPSKTLSKNSRGSSRQIIEEGYGIMVVYSENLGDGSYIVEYDGNGATSGSTASSTHVIGVAKNLTANGFARSGYTFAGWNTKADGSGTSYDDEELVTNLTSTSGATVTLYAQWISHIDPDTGGDTPSIAKYTVNHYRMDTSGAYPVTAQETETRTGTTGTTLTLADLAKDYTDHADYTGFTYAEGKVDGNVVTTATVLSDGLVIDLYYARNQHTVTLYRGAGIDSVSGEGTYYYGQSVTINASVSTGYSWSKWAGTRNTTKQKYTFTMPDDDVTNTAFAKADTYIITLDKQSGSGGTSTLYELYGIKFYIEITDMPAVTSVAVPTRTGYSFGGYYTGTGGNGTQIIDANGEILVKNTYFTADSTIYAKWTHADTEYTVNHYQMDTSGKYPTSPAETENKTGTTGETLTLADLAKDYTGIGFTYEEGKVGGNVVTTTTVLSDGSDGRLVVDLYYARNQYTVTLKKGTGIDSVSGEGTYYHGQSVTINASVSTGYTWSKWSGTHNTTTQKYTFTMPTEDVTDTANATANPYTIQYDENGGSAVADLDYNITTDVTLATAPTKTGYTFNGWQLSAKTGNWDAGIYNANEKVGTGKYGNITLVAQWEVSGNTKYTVNHYQMDISGSYPTKAYETETLTGTTGTTLTLSNLAKDYTKIGFTYAEGKVRGNTVTTTTILADGTRVVDLYYARNQYTVTLKKGTGIASVSGDGTYYHGQSVTINATASTGYTWSKWTGTHNTTTQKYTFTMPTNDVTDTANATPYTYTVEYDGNGATSGSTASSTHIYDVEKNLTANGFTRKGHIFKGWSMFKSGTGNLFSDQESVINLSAIPDDIVTLYAQWEPINYFVTFNGNGGEGSMEDQEFEYNVREALNPNQFVKPGYVFAHWDGPNEFMYVDGALVMNLTDVDGGVVELIAAWRPVRYTVRFDANGGEGTMDDQRFNLNEEQPLTANAFTRTDYRFIGWALSADGEKVYEDEQAVKNLATTDGAVIVLYAVWSDEEDEGPEITAWDRWFTLDEAQNGKITYDELMSTASAEDSPVGDVTDFSEKKDNFIVIDYDEADFKSFSNAGSTTVTYRAEDKAGNIALKTVTVHIVNEGNLLNNSNVIANQKIRFISDKYYLDNEGDFVDYAFGGLSAYSKWVTDSSYVNVLTNTLSNICSDGNWAVTPAYSFTFDSEDITAMKSFVNSYGVGCELIDFYNVLCALNN